MLITLVQGESWKSLCLNAYYYFPPIPLFRADFTDMWSEQSHRAPCSERPRACLKLCCHHLEVINNFIVQSVFRVKSDGTMKHAHEQRRYVQNAYLPFLFNSFSYSFDAPWAQNSRWSTVCGSSARLKVNTK